MGSKFETKIILGNQYKHKHSNIKGTAMAVYFYLHGCERVGILPKNSENNSWINFDASELEGITAENPGGPRYDNPQKYQ